MSSALLSFLPTAAIQERVPERVMPKAVSAASVVTARNKVRYTPISGQTYSSNGQNICTFRITDASSWLDLATAAIHMRAQVGSGAAQASQATAPVVFDDLISSIFDRIRVSVNGVLVEDVTDVNVKAIAEAQASATFDFYRSAHGEQAGAWKFNRELGGQRSVTIGTANPAGLTAVGGSELAARAWQYANSWLLGAGTASGADTQGHSFAVPLSFLTGLAKIGQQFPLRLVGNLEIVLFLAAPGACEQNGGANAVNPSGALAAAQDYQISDVTLEVDSLTLAPMVVAAYDKLAAADSSEGGVVIPVDVITTNRINYASTVGVKSIQVSRGTTQLLSLHIVKRNGSTLTNQAQPSLSTHLPLGAISQQTQIGAVFYPAMKDDSQARMWHTSAKAYGKQASQFSAGLVSRDRYQSDAITEGGADGTLAANGTPAAATPTDWLLNQHFYAISYEQEAQENIDLQGISTLASGSVIQVNIEDGPTNTAGGGVPNPGVSTPVANVFIRSRRYLQLANQSVQVIGN